jgi:integrase
MGAGRRRFGRIRKLASGRYQVRYQGPDGVTRPAPQTFKDKRSADVWLSRTEAQITEGRWLDPATSSLTVGEWGRRWLTSVTPTLKRKTVASYEGLWRLLVEPRFGALPLPAVRPIAVAEWVSEMRTRKLSPSRVRQAYRLLSQIMTAAVGNELLATSPCRGIKLPKMPQTEPHILTEAEAASIAANTRPPYDLLIWVLAYTGLRVGEVFALQRRDVDLTSHTLTVARNVVEIGGRPHFDTPKSGKPREVSMPDLLTTKLRVHLDAEVDHDPESLIFTSQRGTVLRYNSWRRTHFDPAVMAAGLTDVTPHDLRASHATWVADRYGPIAAAKRLGHSNASVTTRHYARAVEGRDADVAKSFDTGARRAQAPFLEP